MPDTFFVNGTRSVSVARKDQGIKIVLLGELEDYEYNKASTETAFSVESCRGYILLSIISDISREEFVVKAHTLMR